MVLPLAIVGVTVAGCPERDGEGVVRIGVDEGLSESGVAPYLQTAFEAEAKVRSRFVVLDAARLDQAAERGDVDVVLLLSGATTDRLEREGLADRIGVAAHEEFIFIGPPLERDPLGRYKHAPAVEVLRSIARSAHRYQKARVGTIEHDKHASLFAATGDPREPSSFLSTDLSGKDFVREVIDSKSLGLVRRSSVLLAAEEGRFPHAVYKEGDPDLSLELVVAEIHPARTRRPRHPEFYDFMLSERGRSIFEVFGKERFGNPVFGAGSPPEEEGVKSPRLERPEADSRR